MTKRQKKQKNHKKLKINQSKEKELQDISKKCSQMIKVDRIWLSVSDVTRKVISLKIVSKNNQKWVVTFVKTNTITVFAIPVHVSAVAYRDIFLRLLIFYI